MPYNYTLDPELDWHPRSRVISEISEEKLPFASRDDMSYIKAKASNSKIMMERELRTHQTS